MFYQCFLVISYNCDGTINVHKGPTLLFKDGIEANTAMNHA